MLMPAARPNYDVVVDYDDQTATMSSDSEAEAENDEVRQQTPRVTSLFDALAEEDDDDDHDIVMITEDAVATISGTNTDVGIDDMPPSQRRRTH